ncbi:FecR family protein [Dyadobacter frigoris]|uniref:DUF4974 domain-containing protein n=1 Tax=Dyadobacter frigoris TaxID=2576211 RepID=A0A4U6D9C3_9BACT|nr:FecR family protein [Dyadobacter frigoris]TKT93386.1 DUF4974 domain-containing protein [Dyadobacter frigoris]GLU54699.1 iron dicitrate transporter FecR [Dyadobacter frigoris]
MAGQEILRADRIIHLISRQINGTLSDTEEQELLQWRAELPGNEKLYTDLLDADYRNSMMVKMQAYDAESSLERLKAQMHSPAKSILHWSAYLRVACVVLAATFLVFYLYTKLTFHKKSEISTNKIISPGGSRATLTLADGSVINLDDAGNGELAKQSGIIVRKTSDGQLVYQTVSNHSENEPVTYNEIKTPNGGQYRVILPDGTEVWLNAASSLHYPTRFTSPERHVSLNGEAYFEVKKQDGKSFFVDTENQQVQVLGTHFNVNGYEDEEFVKTTLLEGSVKVKLSGSKNVEAILKPGQQAQLSQSTDLQASKISIQEVDTENVISWKNGYFKFDNISLQELMRQISRWYDVEVVYEGPVKDYEFVGQIERSANLTKVLKVLELGGVHFRIEGKKIIIND